MRKHIDMRKFREVLTVKADGSFTHGRTLNVPCRNGRPALTPNPYTHGTMCATIKIASGNGFAYVHVVVDPKEITNA